MTFRRYQATLILSCMLLISFNCRPKYIDNKSIEQYIAEHDVPVGFSFWDSSWYGAGGTSGKVEYVGDNKMPITDKENGPWTNKIHKEWVPFFIDSARGANDCFIFDYIMSADGSWTWLAIQSPGWGTLDISTCDGIILDLKGDRINEGYETFFFQMEDTSGNTTAEMNLMSYIPSLELTTNWQTAYIPFSLLANMEKFDLSGFKAFGMSPRATPYDKAVHNIIYLDNIVFINSATYKPDQKVLNNITMRENPDAILDKIIMYNWDESVEEWYSTGKDMLPEVVCTPIEKTKIPENLQDGHGDGVLTFKCNMKKGKGGGLTIQKNQDMDWSDFLLMGFDAYLPEDAPEGMIVSVIVLCTSAQQDWDWMQQINVFFPKPGKWSSVRWSIRDFPPKLVKEKIRGFGMSFWINEKDAVDYNGELYLDNWVAWGRGIKISEPILLEKEEYDKAVSKQKFTVLNLKKQANKGFKDDVAGDGKGGWIDQGENDMREFNLFGKQDFLGIPFKIIDPAENDSRSVLILRGQNNEAYPTKAEIEVNKKAAGIYFLHSAAWSTGEVGRYTLVFEDDSQVTFKIKHTQEIFNWWGENNSKLAKTAWQGKNPLTEKYSSSTSLYLYALSNPKPDKKIKKIICETSGDGAFIMLLAVTLTDKGPYLPK